MRRLEECHTLVKKMSFPLCPGGTLISPKMISRATMDTIASEFEAKLAAWKKDNEKKTASRDLTAASPDGDVERFELNR